MKTVKPLNVYTNSILQWGSARFDNIVLGTGFGPSGVVLIDLIDKLDLDIPTFYLDTSLLFNETYTLKETIEDRYNIQIEAIKGVSLEEQAEGCGDKLWEKDPDHCCYLRKVKPLQEYLSDKDAWITGIRRDQSEKRRNVLVVQRDPKNGVIKINPLVGWTQQQVWDYIDENELDYNPLHDEGYASIGCVPCTEPAKGRSGRWNSFEKTECGIHT